MPLVQQIGDDVQVLEQGRDDDIGAPQRLQMPGIGNADAQPGGHAGEVAGDGEGLVHDRRRHRIALADRVHCRRRPGRWSRWNAPLLDNGRVVRRAEADPDIDHLVTQRGHQLARAHLPQLQQSAG